jgi:hypothetical protein
VPALSRLLAEDATFEMPPIPAWFAGRDQVSRFLGTGPLRQPGAFTMVLVAANGQPGFACYLRGHAHAIQVLTVTDAGITHIVTFQQAGLFPAFGLPPRAVPRSHADERLLPEVFTFQSGPRSRLGPAPPQDCRRPGPRHMCLASPRRRSPQLPAKSPACGLAVGAPRGLRTAGRPSKGPRVSGDARESVRDASRPVIEPDFGILVYPPETDGERWRAVFTENGQRRFRPGATEAKLAAKLTSCAHRRTGWWPHDMTPAWPRSWLPAATLTCSA